MTLDSKIVVPSTRMSAGTFCSGWSAENAGVWAGYYDAALNHILHAAWLLQLSAECALHC